MKALPQNKSQERQFPAVLWIVVACIAIGADLIIARTRNTKHESVTIPNPVVLAPGGERASSSREWVTVDLGKFFNADRHSNWLGGSNALKGLVGLPSGIAPLDGVPFQLDEIVQLCGVGTKTDTSKFPKSIDGIPIKRKCIGLHFLHSTGWTMPINTAIAAYVVHYSDGGHEEIPVVFGTDTRGFLFSLSDPVTTNDTAWYSLTSAKERENLRLYESTWVNPKPEVAVTAIDFISLGTKCAPFLLAITAEVAPK
jgi:hypothetical protein